MSQTESTRGRIQRTGNATWSMPEEGKTAPDRFQKRGGIDFSAVDKADRSAVTSVDVVPTENLTLAPRKEYLSKVFAIENGVAKLAQSFDKMELGPEKIVINWNHDITILTGLLNTVKFHQIIGKTTRDVTKDALKLLCLVTGVDIANTSEDDKFTADGLVTRAMLAYGGKRNLMLSTYFKIMNNGDLTYLKNRRYFPPALKDLADAYYVETNYGNYWKHLFKDNKFTTRDLYATAFDYGNQDAYVYTLNFFNDECNKNITAFRDQHQNNLDRAAAALLVVKEKRENVPFPTSHKRFGDRANKRHIYVMARNAWDEHLRIERQREYMTL